MLYGFKKSNRRLAILLLNEKIFIEQTDQKLDGNAVAFTFLIYLNYIHLLLVVSKRKSRIKFNLRQYIIF